MIGHDITLATYFVLYFFPFHLVQNFKCNEACGVCPGDDKLMAVSVSVCICCSNLAYKNANLA